MARQIYGLFLLRMRLNLTIWLLTLVQGILIPALLLCYSVSQNHELAHRFVFGAVIVSALLVNFRQPVFNIAYDRLIDRSVVLCSSGVTKYIYLTAVAIEVLCLLIVPIVFGLIAFIFVGTGSPQITTWILPLVTLCGALFGFGLLIVSQFKRAAGIFMAANLAVGIQMAICPLLYAADRVPTSIRPLVDVLPASIALELMNNEWHGGGLAEANVVILFIWCGLLLALGVGRFRWPAR